MNSRRSLAVLDRERRSKTVSRSRARPLAFALANQASAEDAQNCTICVPPSACRPDRQPRLFGRSAWRPVTSCRLVTVDILISAAEVQALLGRFEWRQHADAISLG